MLDTSIYAQLAFWNVGQGNCTLIKSPGASDTNPGSLWIIDAGTHGGLPRKNWDFNDSGAIEKAQIEQDIQDWVRPSYFRNLNFVLSHPDTDHYNLMNSIRSMFTNTVTVRQFIGKEYSGTPVYSKVNVMPDNIIEIDGPASFDWNGEAKPDKDSVIFFLNEPGRDPKAEPNDNSLIVHVKYGGVFSFLLTGDATTTTYTKSKIKEIDWSHSHTILQISHHGSERDGCTSPALLNDVQAGTFIISAPLVVGGHDHPKNSVVQQIVSYCKANPDNLLRFTDQGHFICSNDETNDMTQICRQKPQPSINNDDLVLISQFNTNTTPPEQKDLCATKLPLFTTGCNGTIIWAWNNVDNEFYFNFFETGGKKLTTFYPDNEIHEAAVKILTAVQNIPLAPLNFRLVFDYIGSDALDVIRASVIPRNLVALDLRNNKIEKYWNKERVENFLGVFPKLQVMAMHPSGDQMDEDYLDGLTAVERRFYNFFEDS